MMILNILINQNLVANIQLFIMKLMDLEILYIYDKSEINFPNSLEIKISKSQIKNNQIELKVIIEALNKGINLESYIDKA